MPFKSKLGWFEFGAKLPTRDGAAQGHSVESRMLLKTPADGLRTQLRNHPDGSVTMLRTRNGWPEFTTRKVQQPVAAPSLRGFVARIANALSGLMFWPVDMVKRKAPYTPVGHTYFVAPFATAHNAKAATGTHWNDVWALVGTDLQINRKPYAPLGALSIPQALDGIPYIIPKASGDYGAIADNASPIKRVFSVGRDAVAASTDGSVTAPLFTLAPIDVRSKAVLLGQRVDSAGHAASLGQFHFTGSAWNDVTGSWTISSAQVAMLLTPPYLQATTSSIDAVQADNVPAFTGQETINETVSEALPSAEFGLIGTGETAGYNFDDNAFTQYINVVFPFRTTFSISVPGQRSRTGATMHWLGELTSSQTTTLGEFGVASTNSVQHSSTNDGLGASPCSVDLPPANTVNFGGMDGEQVAAQTNWPYSFGDSMNGAANWVPRGPSAIEVGAIGFTGSGHVVEDIQSGEFSVTFESIPLITGNFARHVKTGTTVQAHPVTGNYAGHLANPYGWINQTDWLGANSIVFLRLGTFSPSSCIGLRGPALQAKAAEFVGGACYYCNNLNDPLTHYTGSVDAIDPVNNRAIHWETRDYILHDVRDGVSIYVRGAYDAEQQGTEAVNATLTVSLVVESGFGTAVTTLYSGSFIFTEILPTVELDHDLGIDYVPSPRLTTAFVPKYREQGAFKGAAYTTPTEELAGATPACLLNFVLRLDTFSAIGQDEPASLVSYIPINLLEMLYAYVFSYKYGVDPYDRYPIDYATNYTQLQSSLFGQQFRIAFKDGVFVDWLDTFGGLYESETTTELYRT